MLEPLRDILKSLALKYSTFRFPSKGPEDMGGNVIPF